MVYEWYKMEANEKKMNHFSQANQWLAPKFIKFNCIWSFQCLISTLNQTDQFEIYTIYWI